MALLVDVTRDARYGARMLLGNPGSSAIAIVTLALGIGVTSAVFTIVNAVLFRPLPFHDPDRLVAVIAVPDQAAGFHPVPNASFVDLQRRPAVAAVTTHFDVSACHADRSRRPGEVERRVRERRLRRDAGCAPDARSGTDRWR
jgi:hypothetical protein